MSPTPARIADRTAHVGNPLARPGGAWPAELDVALDEAEAAAAAREIRTWPGYAQTPLVDLAAHARRLGLGQLLYKDEGSRFGLGSFKALGGAYAVSRLLARHVERRTGAAGVSAHDLLSGIHRETTREVTVCCATDGNHGRSVAWGAHRFGCRCVIYVHATVSEARAEAVRRLGAEVVRHPGNYDETVRRADEDARDNGWTVVSDTSWEGYTDIPRDVMHGYTLMCEEALDALPHGVVPTHALVPGGVGGVAAAVCATLWWRYGATRPRLVVVEPRRAACLMESAHAGRRTALAGDIETVMAGLSCGEPSLLAWPVLAAGCRDFVAVDDEAAVAAMRSLAEGDPPVVAGESAASVVAALERAAREPTLRAALGLDAGSRVLAFGTEGDTDPELYSRLVGRSADAVRAGRR